MANLRCGICDRSLSTRYEDDEIITWGEGGAGLCRECYRDALALRQVVALEKIAADGIRFELDEYPTRKEMDEAIERSMADHTYHDPDDP